jgi:hypothetical protein
MTTSNKCQGTIHTCEVSGDGFGTDHDFDQTQRARLDRLKEQYREWSKKYSQRESMPVDEYMQGLDEMADMSSELDAIMKQTGPMDAYGSARSMSPEGALIYYDAESGLLNNIASAQRQYLRVGINIAPDHPLIAQSRWDSMLEALAMMKSSSAGGPRAAIGRNRINSMRNIVANWRGGRSSGVAVQAKPARPSWRQSEVDAGKRLGDGYSEQRSFKDGKEVPYGTKGSTRPDWYKEGSSIEVKNYDVQTSAGQNRLVDNVVNQSVTRANNLPPGTIQSVIIDVRGQTVSRGVLNDIVNRISTGSNGIINSTNITIVR